MAEWLKAPVSKTGMLARVSEVRILPLPPKIEIAFRLQNAISIFGGVYWTKFECILS